MKLTNSSLMICVTYSHSLHNPTTSLQPNGCSFQLSWFYLFGALKTLDIITRLWRDEVICLEPACLGRKICTTVTFFSFIQQIYMYYSSPHSFMRQNLLWYLHNSHLILQGLSWQMALNSKFLPLCTSWLPTIYERPLLLSFFFKDCRS